MADRKRPLGDARRNRNELPGHLDQHLNPILTVEAEITPIERVRTSKRAFERMVDLLRSRADDGADAWMVQHIQAPKEAAELAARGTEIFGSPPTVVSEIGPVIGTHVGPGLLGAGGIPSSLLA